MPDYTFEEIENNVLINPYQFPVVNVRPNSDVDCFISEDQFPSASTTTVVDYLTQKSGITWNKTITLGTGLGIDSLATETPTTQTDALTSDNSSLHIFGMNELRYNYALYNDEVHLGFNIMGSLLPYVVPKVNVIYGKDLTKTGTWTDVAANTAPIEFATSTGTKDDYVEFVCPEGNSRYIAIQFIVLDTEVIDWLISINGNPKIRHRFLGVVSSNTQGLYVHGIVFDSGDNTQKTIRITNNETTGGTKYISFVSSWSDDDITNDRHCLVVVSPKTNYVYHGIAPANAATYNKELYIADIMKDACWTLRRHKLPISYYKFQANMTNCVDPTNQLIPARRANAKFADEILSIVNILDGN